MEPSLDLILPVRYCRVLYALPTDRYRSWKDHVPPEDQEYFYKYSSLGSFTSRKMRRFFRMLQETSYFDTSA